MDSLGLVMLDFESFSGSPGFCRVIISNNKGVALKSITGLTLKFPETLVHKTLGILYMD